MLKCAFVKNSIMISADMLEIYCRPNKLDPISLLTFSPSEIHLQDDTMYFCLAQSLINIQYNLFNCYFKPQLNFFSAL